MGSDQVILFPSPSNYAPIFSKKFPASINAVGGKFS